MLATTAPMGNNALSNLHSGQPNWSPPPLQSSSAPSSMGLPDLTSLKEGSKGERDWTEEECISIAIHSQNNSFSSSFYIERTGQVKSVLFNSNNNKKKKDVFIEAVIGFDEASAEAIRNSNEKIPFSFNPSSSSASMDVVSPLRDLFSSLNKKEKKKKTLKLSKCSQEALEIDTNLPLKILLQHVYQEALNAFATETSSSSSSTSSSEEKKNKKKKGKGGFKQPLTLIVPSFSSLPFKQSLVDAASSADIPIKNIFSHSIATVAGALFRTMKEKSPSLYQTLSNASKNDFQVLMVQTSSQAVEVSIVVCENIIKARASGSQLQCQVSNIPLLLLLLLFMYCIFKFSLLFFAQRITSAFSEGIFLNASESPDTLSSFLSDALKKAFSSSSSIDAILVDGDLKKISSSLSNLQYSEIPIYEAAARCK